MRTKIPVAAMSLVLAIVGTVLWAVPVAAADRGAPRIAPPASHAYGMTLQEWLGVYWRWSFSGGNPAESTVGRVQLMPIPAGTETPAGSGIWVGELEITLRPGTPFVLPLAGYIGETYNNGLPDDSPVADDFLLAGISPTLTIDGKTIVSDANKAAFYVPATYFDPIVEYPEPTWYGADAAIFYQGIGIVSPPLSVGTHVIHLYEVYSVFGVIYDNTWTITVTPH